LSGDGKALMFVNVSPTIQSSNETLCSLRFANQVSQVELGKAQKQIMVTTVLPTSNNLQSQQISSDVPPSQDTTSSMNKSNDEINFITNSSSSATGSMGVVSKSEKSFNRRASISKPNPASSITMSSAMKTSNPTVSGVQNLKTLSTKSTAGEKSVRFNFPGENGVPNESKLEIKDAQTAEPKNDFEDTMNDENDNSRCNVDYSQQNYLQHQSQQRFQESSLPSSNSFINFGNSYNAGSLKGRMLGSGPLRRSSTVSSSNMSLLSTGAKTKFSNNISSNPTDGSDLDNFNLTNIVSNTPSFLTKRDVSSAFTITNPGTIIPSFLSNNLISNNNTSAAEVQVVKRIKNDSFLTSNNLKRTTWR
jgi:hypothetical protein